MAADDDVNEDRERRDLQRRAYGRGATALTPGEAERLRLLQARPVLDEETPPADSGRERKERHSPDGSPVQVVPELLPPPTTRVRPPSLSASPGGATDEMTTGIARSVAPEQESEPGRVARARGWLHTVSGRLRDGRWWRRPRVMGVAAIGLLALGLAVGLSVPRAPDVSLPLTPQEEQQRAELYRDVGDFDDGSVALLARADGARLWYGNRASGRLSCALVQIEGAEIGRPSCASVADLGNRFFIPMNSTFSPGSRVAYDVQVMVGSNGIPVGALERREGIDRFTPSAGFTEDEQRQAMRFLEEGILGYPLIVGRLENLPVWFVVRESGERCMIVEPVVGGERRACIGALEESEMLWGPGTNPVSPVLEDRIVLAVPGGESKDTAVLELAFNGFGSPYLTITYGALPSFWGTQVR